MAVGNKAMETTRLLSNIRGIKVRERVRKYFKPDNFDPEAFCDMLMTGLMTLMLGELTVFILLEESAELGELPYYITDAVILGVSSVQFLLGWYISWLGSRRRRRVIVLWCVAALLSMVLVFALPGPETTPDAGLCTSTATFRSSPGGVSARAAVRLAMLVGCGLTCALAQLAILAHGLAYIDEYNPSDNMHKHVGGILLKIIAVMLLGNTMLKDITRALPWLQGLTITVQLLLTLLQLHRYPVLAPRVVKQPTRHRGLFRSVGRVLSNNVAMLQILSMSMMVAAFWGFGMHQATFAKVKYHVVESGTTATTLTTIFRNLPLVLGVALAGYMYTAPVMPKYDKKAAVRSAGKLTLLATVMYVLMTAVLGCGRGEVAGVSGPSYNQPACGQTCGCDRPWMEFQPVCVTEQMTTYFSPCHAGCSTPDTVNNVGVYANCSCAASTRATRGACGDGACADAHRLHQTLFMLASLCSTLVIVWQVTVVVESVDARDVSVALGVASGAASLFAFVGAHGFYLGISYFTCAFNRGSRCLLQGASFVPWVGYTTVTLTGLSLLFSLAIFIVLKRQKEPKEDEDIRLD